MGLVDSIWAEGNKYTRQDTGEVTAIALDAEEQEVMKSMLYAQKERLFISVMRSILTWTLYF